MAIQGGKKMSKKRNIYLGVGAALLIALLFAFPVQALLGDLDLNGIVDDADLAILEAAFGSTDGDPNWDYRADINLNDEVDVEDLAIMGRSYHSSFNFYTPRPLVNNPRASIVLTPSDIALDTEDQAHIVWRILSGARRGVYYTRLDRYGNTIVDDLLLDDNSDGEPRIAVDGEGQAYIIWTSGHRLQYALIDAWGHILVAPKTIDEYATVYTNYDVAVDPQGRVHVLYRRGGTKIVYRLLNEEGETWIHQENIHPGAYHISPQIAITTDSVGDPHLVWREQPEYQGDKYLFYAKYAFSNNTEIAPRSVTSLNYPNSQDKRIGLETDSQNNALLMWQDYDGGHKAFFEKISPLGVSLVDNMLILTNSGWPYPAMAVDSMGQVHVVAKTKHLAYGRLNNDGNTLIPFRWVRYGYVSSRDHLVAVDLEQNAHILYKGRDENHDDQLYYMSTVLNRSALDLARPDLGVDAAHINHTPFPIAKWDQQLVITVSVFNNGWTPATNVSVRITEQLNGSQVCEDATIPSLDVLESQIVTFNWTLPVVEDVNYLTLQIEVDPDDTITETTEKNNVIIYTLPVLPLPSNGSVFVRLCDDTNTLRGERPFTLKDETVFVTATGESRNVSISSFYTIVDELELNTTYNFSWSKPGYMPVSQEVTITRDTDPYHLIYDPSNTVELVTNQWGALSGALKDQNGTGLGNAIVRIVGMGLFNETQTSADGSFIFSPLISGTYELWASHVGYARQNEAGIEVATGEMTINDYTAMTTTTGYLRGMVRNQFGDVIPSATVKLYLSNNNSFVISNSSDSNGAFCLDVPNVPLGGLSYYLIITIEPYDAYTSSTFTLYPGLEALQNAVMTLSNWDDVSASGGMVSWYQHETAEGLLPDAPEDSKWFQRCIVDKFKDKFWPSYEVEVWWGCYAYRLTALFSIDHQGDYRLHQVNVKMIPKTFLQHKVSGEGEIEFSEGEPLGVTIAVLQDSGCTSVPRVKQVDLVEVEDDGSVIVRASRPQTSGGESYWDAETETSKDYNFNEPFDWSTGEIYVYLKVGKNNNGFTGSPILSGWNLDRQVLKFDLSKGTVKPDYVMHGFPM